MFSYTHRIFFGDCDPAGIMFYPHHFRLMDATFQAWLASLQLSQAVLREELNIVGTGLLDASASFRSPVRDGNAMAHLLTMETWRRKSFEVRYQGFVGDVCVIESKEVRGLFTHSEKGLVLSLTDPFRNLIAERDNNGCIQKHRTGN